MHPDGMQHLTLFTSATLCLGTSGIKISQQLPKPRYLLQLGSVPTVPTTFMYTGVDVVQ
jgi:hypothetical protein